jgi:hypothetical protein
MLAFLVAGACGCKLNEGSTHPCYMFGIDIGGLLSAMLFSVWLFIIIVPTGLIALAVFFGLSMGLWPKLWPGKSAPPSNKWECPVALNRYLTGGYRTMRVVAACYLLLWLELGAIVVTVIFPAVIQCLIAYPLTAGLPFGLAMSESRPGASSVNH